MSSVIFVVSEMGYWGEECVRPLKRLSDREVEVTVATPTGGPPVIDERSVDPEHVGEDLAREVEDCHQSDPRLNNARAVAEVEPRSFDGAVFPGGHGTVWDVNQDRHARSLLRHMVETDEKKALVVCHAVGMLAFARDSDGGFLVDGREVTGFPNEWEEGLLDEWDRLSEDRKLPYWVEDEVIAAGGRWDAELNEDTSVTVDGDLVTARGPESSERGAEVFLDQLGQ